MGSQLSFSEAFGKAVHDAGTKQGKLAVAMRYHCPPRLIEDDYAELPHALLGSGSTASVRLWKHRRGGSDVAVKSFAVASLGPRERRSVINECRILLSVDHPNVCRALDIYQSNDEVHIVMEKIGGGDMCSFIERNRLGEVAAAEATRQMLAALSYLHGQGILHGDVKLENCLYDPQGAGYVQLIDFSSSRVLHHDSPADGRVGGTLPYAAPEVLRGKPGCKSDVWSLGVCVFTMITGSLPFAGADADALSRSISCGKFERTPAWDKLRAPVKDFVLSLLSVSVDARPSACEALGLPWLRQAHRADCSADVLDALLCFDEIGHVRRACLLAAAWSASSPECSEARKAFSVLDRSNRGIVSAEDLCTLLPDDAHCKARRAFDAVDQKGRGAVHYSELLAALIAAGVLPLRDEALGMAYQRIRCEDIEIVGLSQTSLDRISQAGFARFVLGGSLSTSSDGCEDLCEIDACADHQSFSDCEDCETTNAEKTSHQIVMTASFGRSPEAKAC